MIDYTITRRTLELEAVPDELDEILDTVPWHAPHGLEEYLAATELCDAMHPTVRTIAGHLVTGTRTPTQAAMRIFEHARDHVVFGFDYPLDCTASHTLSKGFGQGILSTNAQVALLRAAGIPARFHVTRMDVTALQGLIPTSVYRTLPARIWGHAWCEAWLDQRWVACETVLDQTLYRAVCRKNPSYADAVPTVDWDGVEDLLVMGAWIVDEIGIFDSPEAIYAQRPRGAVPSRLVADVIYPYSNRYIRHLRAKAAG